MAESLSLIFFIQIAWWRFSSMLNNQNMNYDSANFRLFTLCWIFINTPVDLDILWGILHSSLNILYLILWFESFCELYAPNAVTLVLKCHHFDEIFIVGYSESCHFDNIRCSQWWKFRPNGNISTSVNTKHFYSNFMLVYHFGLGNIEADCAVNVATCLEITSSPTVHMRWQSHRWPLLLTWFNFNPSMDK